VDYESGFSWAIDYRIGESGCTIFADDANVKVTENGSENENGCGYVTVGATDIYLEI